MISKQSGWTTKENILYEILKQANRLAKSSNSITTTTTTTSP